MAKKESNILNEYTQPQGLSKRDQKRRKKRKIKQRHGLSTAKRTFINILILAAGVFCAFAPPVTNYLEYSAYYDDVKEYESVTSMKPKEELSAQLDRAYIYNEQIAADRTPTVEDYETQLSEDGSVMAMLRIPKMDSVLPIYHSTVPEEEVHGVVQIGPTQTTRGSSLPVGGPSTHCYLSNANDLPSSKIFNLISELSAGDSLSISVCGEELAYEVSEAKTISVEDASAISIIQGEDQISLVFASKENDTSRYVVNAKRSPVATKLYLGDYNAGSWQTIMRIVFMNMSIAQGIMFIVGVIVLAVFLLRAITGINDKAPREVGRLTGDTGY